MYEQWPSPTLSLQQFRGKQKKSWIGILARNKAGETPFLQEGCEKNSMLCLGY